MDQFIPRGGGMARLAGRQFRPAMQQTVAINQNADQSHEAFYDQLEAEAIS
jgi:hypothetical protein